jgi:sugar phosphate isomerase/epimerase
MKKQLSRREFLLMGGSAALAAAVLPSVIHAATTQSSAAASAQAASAATAAAAVTTASAATASAATAGTANTATAGTPKIAVQLYTVRDAIARDMPSTFHKLADIGIHSVETAFWPKNVTPKQAARSLSAAGLKVCSSHIELPIKEKRAAMLETAEAFDCKRMIWHGWPEDKRYSSVEGTKQLIEEYNEASAYAKSQGLQLGLHNHWWEYRNKPGGRPVYEYLLEGVTHDVFFELDTYWIKVAGHDPAAIIKKFGPRAKYLHMKDGPAVYNDNLIKDKPDPMVALGKGTQDVPAIATAAKSNIEWMVIEMDVVATDVYQAIKDSKNYLLQHKFATS